MAKLTVVKVPMAGGAALNAEAVTKLVRSMPRDAVVLIVGHSNTIPLIATGLGATTPVTIPDCAFDKLVVLSLGTVPPAEIAGRYGAPSQNCAG